MKRVHWCDDVWAAYDSETTGTDVQTARILQAAIIVHDPEGILIEEDRVFYIDPGVPIPPKASAIHGITAERLATLEPMNARGGIEAVNTIVHSRSANRGYPLVIYNVQYDWPLLLAECARHWMILEGRQPMFLDPLVIYRAADKYRKGSRKLEDVAKFYGVKMDGAAHGAQADAKAAMGIMRALIVKYPELRKQTLISLQRERRNHGNAA
jgi:DNA polymerase-3 subunit epsilon